jgi:hypothetical protein
MIEAYLRANKMFVDYHDAALFSHCSTRVSEFFVCAKYKHIFVVPKKLLVELIVVQVAILALVCRLFFAAMVDD